MGPWCFIATPTGSGHSGTSSLGGRSFPRAASFPTRPTKMDFRRSTQHSERRRRMLSDEQMLSRGSSESTQATPQRRSPAKKTPSYTEAAHMDQQAHITDFIPRRPSVVALWFFSALTVIAGITAAHCCVDQWSVALGGIDLSVLRFGTDSGSGLAAWFSSMMLVGASLVAVLIYALRRHKSDDYRGRYRIWMWAGICWMAMSIDTVSGLHALLKNIIAQVAGSTVWGDGSILWIGSAVSLIGVVALALTMDMRSCRTAVTSMVLSAVAYAVTIAGHFELVVAVPSVLLTTASAMCGHLFLLASMTLFARHVILDAEGLLPEPPPKKQKKKAANNKSTESKSKKKKAATRTKERSDLESIQPSSNSLASYFDEYEDEDDYAFDEAPRRRKQKPKKQYRVDDSHDDEPVSRPSGRKLSKSERKRQRKEKMRQRGI
jgi:hypothetical protein